MNRRRAHTELGMCDRVPRASGDEPIASAAHRWRMNVFPARAGMNRDGWTRSKPAETTRVPRASGDEPSSTAGFLGLHLSSVPRASGDEPMPRARRITPFTGVPRASGDEPAPAGASACSGRVFPARAGMNRRVVHQGRAPTVVFPARAGMNRWTGSLMRHNQRLVFPARAGMNRHLSGKRCVGAVFPARAGMNRRRDCLPSQPEGDRCSPRERG